MKRVCYLVAHILCQDNYHFLKPIIMTQHPSIDNTDNFDVGTGKINPQTHGTTSLNESGNDDMHPEIEPAEPLPAEEKPIKFSDTENSEKDVDRTKQPALTSVSGNEAMRRDNNKSMGANPDNEPAQEGGYNGKM
jgi:hypothetical protein